MRSVHCPASVQEKLSGADRGSMEAFSEKEARLRQIMNEDKNHERGGELIEQCEHILNLAFDDISIRNRI